MCGKRGEREPNTNPIGSRERASCWLQKATHHASTVLSSTTFMWGSLPQVYPSLDDGLVENHRGILPSLEQALGIELGAVIFSRGSNASEFLGICLPSLAQLFAQLVNLPAVGVV
jgi:hypothetical protein